MAKAAFFDRDGTLIKDVHYLSRLDDVELIPGIIPFCKKLQAQGYVLLVVTNQSGIARNYFDRAFVERTHCYLDELFQKEGVFFKQFYYCPHGPNDGCRCRKPKPGMLEQAGIEHTLDLQQSLMFGDKELDLLAGRAAGCKSFEILSALRSFDEA